MIDLKTAPLGIQGYNLCLDCGYSLRGLPPGSRCPECGEQSAERQLVIVGHKALLDRRFLILTLCAQLPPILTAFFIARRSMHTAMPIFLTGLVGIGVLAGMMYQGLRRGRRTRKAKIDPGSMVLILSPKGINGAIRGHKIDKAWTAKSRITLSRHWFGGYVLKARIGVWDIPIWWPGEATPQNLEILRTSVAHTVDHERAKVPVGIV